MVVEYGTTPNYGTQTASQDIGAGIAPAAVPVAIAGLPEHTTFHYRFRATNSEGSVVSADHIFRTLNSAPFAGDDRVTAGGAITLQPLANDGDADGDALAIIEVTPASFGTVTFTANSVTYTPGAAGLRGDRFTYTVTDGFGGTATANVIIDLPLDSFRGQYSQLFTGPGGVAGRIQLTLGGGGLFTGQMLFGDLSAVLTGKFEADGVFRGTVSNRGINFAITLALRLDGAGPHLAGTISDGATTWTSDGGAAGPSSFGLKGRYTFAVPDSHQPGIPRGDAWAVFAGNSLGHLRFIGRFADGAKFSGDGEMQPDGAVPIYILRTDAPAESLGGALRFSDVRGTNLTGNFTWTRFAGGNGFAVTSPIVGSRFVPPAAGKPIFTFRNSAAKIVKATLAADLPGFPKKQIFNVSANRIEAVLPNANGFVLQFSRTTGQFGGTFNHRTLGRCKVSGVLVQPANAVRGNFAGGGASGSFLLAPR